MSGSTGNHGARGRPEGQKAVRDRWGAWREFQRIRDDIDRMIGGPFHPVPRWLDESQTLSPVVLLYETPEQIVFVIRLADVSPDEIHVEVVGQTVHVWGYGTPACLELDAAPGHVRDQRGRFDVRYLLPVAVEGGGCEASVESGLIEVRLYKAGRSQGGGEVPALAPSPQM